MDLLTVNNLEANSLTHRGFDLIGRVNEVVLPILFPGHPAGLRLHWDELRTLFVILQLDVQGRDARVCSKFNHRPLNLSSKISPFSI